MEAILGGEARHIKRCERRQRSLGGPWENVNRMVDQIKTGIVDPNLRDIETLWRDPATPTVAQRADATVKLVQAGVLPVEAAWEDLGYSAARRERLRAQRDSQQSDPLIANLLRPLPNQAPPPANAVGG